MDGDTLANFAQARTAPPESCLAERLVARVQLTRSVVLFSWASVLGIGHGCQAREMAAPQLPSASLLPTR
jgi:hypothetical protein